MSNLTEGNTELYLFVDYGFDLMLYVPVNSYGHIGMVSSLTTLFPGQDWLSS